MVRAEGSSGRGSEVLAVEVPAVVLTDIEVLAGKVSPPSAAGCQGVLSSTSKAAHTGSERQSLL